MSKQDDDDSRPPFKSVLDRLGARGPTLCTTCQVVELPRPGDCDACAASRVRAERRRLLRFPRETVPAGLRDRRLEDDRMSRYAARSAIDQAEQIAKDIVGGRCLHRGITFSGPSGSAKTSMACGILARIHEAATSSEVDSPAFERARRAFFVLASDLAAEESNRFATGNDRRLRDLAMAATVLVLDEVHLGGTVARDVIHNREAMGSLTIVTTWMGYQELVGEFGSGVARRLTDLVIPCPVVARPS